MFPSESLGAQFRETRQAKLGGTRCEVWAGFILWEVMEDPIHPGKEISDSSPRLQWGRNTLNLTNVNCRSKYWVCRSRIYKMHPNLEIEKAQNPQKKKKINPPGYSLFNSVKLSWGSWRILQDFLAGMHTKRAWEKIRNYHLMQHFFHLALIVRLNSEIYAQHNLIQVQTSCWTGHIFSSCNNLVVPAHSLNLLQIWGSLEKEQHFKSDLNGFISFGQHFVLSIFSSQNLLEFLWWCNKNWWK